MLLSHCLQGHRKGGCSHKRKCHIPCIIALCTKAKSGSEFAGHYGISFLLCQILFFVPLSKL